MCWEMGKISQQFVKMDIFHKCYIDKLSENLRSEYNEVI